MRRGARAVLSNKASITTAAPRGFQTPGASVASKGLAQHGDSEPFVVQGAEELTSVAGSLTSEGGTSSSTEREEPGGQSKEHFSFFFMSCLVTVHCRLSTHRHVQLA